MLIIDLSALDSTFGFTIRGTTAGEYAGRAVAHAGDVDGDGFDDVIVGTLYNYGSGVRPGDAYIVFGGSSLDGDVVNLSSLDGFDGFQLQGSNGYDAFGSAVGGGFDFNGDGFADLLVGAYFHDGGVGAYSGAAYLVFGQLSQSAATTAVADLDGADGFHIPAIDSDSSTGFSVNRAGDVNGDGLDDIILGAPDATNANDYDGSAFVVFGRTDNVGPTFDLAGLDGADGFRLNGVDLDDGAGIDVSSAGDVNGDGLDDIIVSATFADPNGPDSGETYVVFGRASGFSAVLSLADLDGSDGFRLEGENAGDQAGLTVSHAGDFNGDGIGDLLIGAPYVDFGGYYSYDVGRSYVVFGDEMGFAPVVQLGGLDGTNGIRIDGTDSGYQAGFVAAAGDVNADGMDDIVIGAPLATDNAGEAFIVFGTDAILPRGQLALNALDASQGTNIVNPPNNDSILGFDVAGGGDVNGDGFDDVILGAPYGNVMTGEAFVVFGFDSGAVTHQGTISNDTLMGDAGANVFVGGRGRDILQGMGGADVFNGGSGFDDIEIGDVNFARIDGGSAIDTVRLNASAMTLDLTPTNDQRISDVEAFDLNGAGAALTLDELSVLRLSSTSNTVFVNGLPGTTLNLTDAGDWTAARSTNADVTLENGQATLIVDRDVDIPMALVVPPPAAYRVGALDGADGFRVDGFYGGGRFGLTSSDAGDVNGDGFEDFIVSAPESQNGSFIYAGRTYVVFGADMGFGAAFDVSNLDGTNGFEVVGFGANAYSGVSLGGGGDVNGDGFADIIIGGFGEDYTNTGESYVIFGRDSGFSASMETTFLDGTNGFTIDGIDSGDQAGFAVDIAGDVNGDGYDDLIVGARYADPGGNFRSGQSYIVFGMESGFGRDVSLADLDGTDGFSISGVDTYDYSGFDVSAAGDVNGDGVDDLIIGASDAAGLAGRTYVVFGSTGPFGTNLSLDDLDGADGFAFTGPAAGDEAGRAVSDAGDINGDGYGDLLIGAELADQGGTNSGSAFVVFGDAMGFATEMNLGDLDGADGFRLDGFDNGYNLGASLSRAGDVNGDGFDDFIVGAPGGLTDGETSDGLSFVVFGRTASFGANFDLRTLDGTDGFAIEGAGSSDYAGTSVSAAGDIDGDGFDDVFVGAPYATSPGEGYIIFGADTGAATEIGASTMPETLTGTAGIDVLIGGAGSDLLQGQGGADVLIGGIDDDVVEIGDANFRRIDGGTGVDAIRTTDIGISINLAADAQFNRVQNIERFELMGANNTLTLDKEAVLGLSETQNQVVIEGTATTTLNLTDAGDWTATRSTNESVTLTNDQATIIIDREATLPGGLVAPPPAAILLGELDGSEGFTLTGEAPGDASGAKVAAAGDVNGDGFADFLISAYFANDDSGAAYVVFGQEDAFSTPIALADLDGADGFKLVGDANGNQFGRSLKAAGDVDGDGVGDIIIGADLEDPNGDVSAGQGFVLFGRDTDVEGDFAAEVDLTTLDGADGFTLNGTDSGDFAGRSVAGAGDVNGDGFADLIIGASGGDFGSNLNSGEAHIVFGSSTGFDTFIELADLDGADGFTLTGLATNDFAGISVATAGDVNGDGLADILVGATGVDASGANSGAAFLLFQRDAPGDATFDLSSLDGSDGVRLFGAPGEAAGYSVAAAGDMDGDGFDDVIIGTRYGDGNAIDAGRAYVLYGRSNSFGSDLSLAGFEGSIGFRIEGVAANDITGFSVEGAGDVNGDGFDDVIVGGPSVDPNNVDGAGAGFVIFGSGTRRTGQIDVDALDGTDGFRLDGAQINDQAGFSVDGAGDVNGDGFDDIIIAARAADPIANDEGETYIVYGADTGAVDQIGTNASETLTGDAMANVIVGAQGDDTLVGGGGLDVLRGGEGDDILDVADGMFERLAGGAGKDVIRFSGADQMFNPTVAGNESISSIEAFEFTGANADLTLDAVTVRSLSETTNRVDVSTDATGGLTLTDGDWVSTFIDDTHVLLANGSAEVFVTRTTGLTVTNVGPDAVDDAVAGDEDTNITGDVLADNGSGADSDPDGDVLFVDLTPVVDVTDGLLILNSDGSFTYTPDQDFNGVDSFVYEVTDGKGDFSQATVTITVNSVNDDPVAEDDDFSVDEDMTLMGDVLDDNGFGFDDDVDGDALEVFTAPIDDVDNGTLTLNDDGTFTYVPDANFNGVDSFVYEITDNASPSGFATATATITVNAVNDDPVGVADNFIINEDGVAMANVLANNGAGADSDVDGDMLTVDTMPVTDVSNGVLMLMANGDFTYTPNADFNGADNFVYRVQDGNGGTDDVAVTILINAVNDDPVAQDDGFAVLEDDVLMGDVLANNENGPDQDVDGDMLTVDTMPVTDVANGTLTLMSDGTFEYTPDADFNGGDSFEYRITDGNGGEDTATVTIVVDPVNDAPVGQRDVFAFDEDTNIMGDVLADNGMGVDADIDGDMLTVSTTLDLEPAFGTVDMMTDGTFTFTTEANRNGNIVFSYRLLDGNGGQDIVLVNLNIAPVNDAPTVDSPVTATFSEDDADATVDLLNGARDVDGDMLSLANLTLVGGDDRGLTIDGSNIDVAPSAYDDLGVGEMEVVTYTYDVVDGNGGSTAQMATITINGANDAPVNAMAVRANPFEDDPAFSVDLLSESSDVDGDMLGVQNVMLLMGDDRGATVNGTMIDVDPSQYSFLAGGEMETLRYRYDVVDGNGGVTSQNAIIMIRGANLDPDAADDEFEVATNSVLMGNVIADNGNGLDSDPEGDPLTIDVAATTAPSFGALTIQADGSFVYDPDDGFVGLDTFEYTLLDGLGGMATATVTIDVTDDLTNLFINNFENNEFVGDGLSVVSYEDVVSGGIFADLGDGFINGDSSGRDEASGIFEIRGTMDADTIFGSDEAPSGSIYSLLADFVESFQGGAGDDIIFGGGPNDQANDRANYDRSPNGVMVDLSEALALDDGYGDTDILFSIEGVRGTFFDDILIGDENDNFFEPLRGSDAIDGQGGLNSLIFVGIDTAVTVNLAGQTYSHNDGTTSVVRNIQRIEGGGGDDVFTGAIFAPLQFRGGEGDDMLTGGGLFDELIGDAGDDTLTGEGGDDRLLGRDGDDMLAGGAGADRLFGNGDNDMLAGGEGDDILQGDAGLDTFIFDLNSGIDTINDFSTGDLIDVELLGIETFAEIQAILSFDANGAEIAFNGTTDVLRLTGVQDGDLSAGSFIFSDDSI